MQTRKLGIELDAGADFNVVIGIMGDSGPIDITGYTFKGQVRMSTATSSAQPVAEFAFTVLDQSTNKGQVAMALPASSDGESEITTSVSDALRKLRLTTPFVFDVKMKDTVGTISRIIEGLIYVSPEATQELF